MSSVKPAGPDATRFKDQLDPAAEAIVVADSVSSAPVRPVTSSLRYRPVGDFQSSLPELSAVNFDPWRQTVLLVLGDERVEIQEGEWSSKRRIHVGHTGPIRDAKLAPGGGFLGVLRSAKMLEILEIDESEHSTSVQELVRDSHSSSAILGFEWTFPGELMVVSSSGFELYQYSGTSKNFVKKKSREARINWYSYWPEVRILVTSVGPLALRLYHMKLDSGADSLMTVNLKPKGNTSGVQSQATRKQITVFFVYGRAFLGYFDLTPDPPLLVLYRISRSTPSHSVSYPLDGRGTFIANTVDNLIVVTNVVTKLFLIFDMKNDGTEAVVSTARIPVQDENDIDAVIEWQPCFPDYILVGSRGMLYCIQVDLQALAHDMRENSSGLAVVTFLARRDMDDPTFVLQIVAEMMREGASVDQMRKAFDPLNSRVRQIGPSDTPQGMIRDSSTDSVNSLGSIGTSENNLNGSAAGSPTARRKHQAHAGSASTLQRALARSHEEFNATRRQLCTQELLFANVFEPLSKEATFPSVYLTSCLFEYIASLSVAARQTVQPCFHELVCDLLLRDNRHTELHQLVQYNVVEDSAAVARRLLARGDVYAPFKQLGLDMLKRLDANNEVADVLLNRGEFLDALRYAVSRSVTTVPPTSFLEAALQSGDRTLFLNTYKCLEDRGMMTAAHADQAVAGLPPGSAAGRYVSVFREMWGEVVEMDSMIDM
ncbi:hypothetical protein HDU87_007469 [Geranomyces variabilis]|uniref:Mic1 domain-containing protein n=1 Tax=Geranomyces variabilis TaxID=109894 RepID=A0AAD5TPH7_9FUNG|nr:hypothetical protein HDU87_007469 [Geranomyces variabilis]